MRCGRPVPPGTSLLLFLVAAFLLAPPASGQEPSPPPERDGPEGQAVTVQEVTPVSTGGAFLRSLLVPGWGHVATRTYVRGGFYVAAQSSAFWMLWKSATQRSEARRLRFEERDVVLERLRAQGVTDPDSLRILADADPAMEEWDNLLESRDEQVEDWIALAVFMTLLGAADAFVAAHLMDFPEPLSIQVRPRSAARLGGPQAVGLPGVELQLSLPVDTFRPLARLLPGRSTERP
jgi:hypothetical protein